MGTLLFFLFPALTGLAIGTVFRDPVAGLVTTGALLWILSIAGGTLEPRPLKPPEPRSFYPSREHKLDPACPCWSCHNPGKNFADERTEWPDDFVGRRMAKLTGGKVQKRS